MQVIVSKIHFFADGWTKGTLFFMAGGQRPWNIVFCNIATCCIKARQLWLQESSSKAQFSFQQPTQKWHPPQMDFAGVFIKNRLLGPDTTLQMHSRRDLNTTLDASR